ncbi:MAG: TRAP transporter small permease [Firmicutes bacterium]|nr:TRAP transporter small permease [Bacillota bacterium]
MVKFMERAELFLGVVFLSTFFITILIQIFARYFGIAAIWTEEVANYSFIWSVFMGASVMIKRKSHFRFSLLLEKLEGKARIYLNIIINIILLLFNISVFYYGIIATKSFWNYRWIALPDFKMGYVFLCLPIMGITMAIYVLADIIKNVQSIREGGQ